MKPSLKKVALLTAIVFGTASLKAEVVTEASLGSGYQGNLFNDSTSIGDTYAAAGVMLKYYPAASTQLAGGMEYNSFIEQRDLSHLSGELSITVIPTAVSSPVALTLNGNLTGRAYGTIYKPYNYVRGMAGTSLGVRLSKGVYLLSSGSYVSTEYTNSAYGSNRGFDLSCVAHLTVLGRNALALGVSYANRDYDQPSPIIPDGHNTRSSEASVATPAVIEYLVRYSRPLGNRTGLKLSGSRRYLQVDENYAAPGYTVDYLSPWADLWEGYALSGGVKHFFPKQVTAEISLGFLDKRYVDAVELDATSEESYLRDTRTDQTITLGLSLARPFTLTDGTLLTPSLRAEYRENSSSAALHNYSDASVALSISLSL